MDYTITFHYAPQENCSMEKLTVFDQVKKYLSATEPECSLPCHCGTSFWDVKSVVRKFTDVSEDSTGSIFRLEK
jgi:metal-dependent hydrolase (beta-lactamase superfamily II)